MSYKEGNQIEHLEGTDLSLRQIIIHVSPSNSINQVSRSLTICINECSDRSGGVKVRWTLKDLDHYLHHDEIILQLLSNYNDYSVFAHLLVLKDLDHHQNLIRSLTSQDPPIKLHNPFITFWVMLLTHR